MGRNIGALPGILRSIAGKGPGERLELGRQRKIGLAEMERVRSRIGQRNTFLGGIQPFGGERRRGGGGLFGGAASTAAQQTFGG